MSSGNIWKAGKSEKFEVGYHFNWYAELHQMVHDFKEAQNTGRTRVCDDNTNRRNNWNNESKFKRSFRLANLCLQQNMRNWIELRNWPWMRLMQMVQKWNCILIDAVQS